MFQKKEFTLFGHSAIALSHEDEKYQLTIIPQSGAQVQRLVVKGQDLIDGFANEEEVKSNAWGKSGLLYPFPNRLEDGKYTWLDKEYQFPINDQDTDNALHGFGMQQALTVENITLEKEQAVVELQGAYSGDLVYYPWAISIHLRYTLSLEAGFSMKLEIKNESKKPIPVGMGWHPYFWLGDNPEQAQLKLPPVAQVEIDCRMIPTGSLVAMDEFIETKKINGTQLDTGFKLFRPGKRSEAELTIPAKGTLKYWQESGFSKYKYLQVFIPPARKSIALEPMTCNIDAFNNKNGLVRLMPGKSLSANCGVDFELA